MHRPQLAKRLQEQTNCFEVEDSSSLRIPAHLLIRGGVSSVRDPNPHAARLGRQFIKQNSGLLADFKVDAALNYDGINVDIELKSGTCIGAFPLMSPTSGRPDYGLVIRPRFNWSGLGPMLATMGWKTLPTPLRLPPIPGTERKVPSWVLSSVVVFRLKQLLDKMERRFELVENVLNAPRGHINWSTYLTQKMPQAKFLQVPCQFPDLRDDRELKSAIHYTLNKQLYGLQSQRHTGIAAIQLIDLCQDLLAKVNNVSPRIPMPKTIESWLHGSLKTEVFNKGIQAIEWTVDDRGLAGISDLRGLPWIMPMEVFFESWIESVAEALVRTNGGKLRVGRKHETVYPITWDPPYTGSQKSLIPDFIIEKERSTIILDAKYKSHWEELNFSRWSMLGKQLRERHREDLMQILAYSNLSDKSHIISCLVYPCRMSTWQSLQSRNRISHRASVRSGVKHIELILIAIPMDSNIHGIVKSVADQVYT